MIRWRLALATFVSLALAGMGFWHFASASSLFVRDRGVARWLVADAEGWPGTHAVGPRAAAFRTAFRSEVQTPPLALTLRAVERAVVELDGETIYSEAEPDPLGRVERRVALGALREGEHELAIYVVASASPPLLWAQSDPPLVATGPGWQQGPSHVEAAWHAARLATDAPEPFELSREFPHAGRAFARVLPVLLPLFLVVAWIERRGRPLPTPGQLRWGLLALWAGLAANNLMRVPAGVGMDLSAHLAYVVHLVDQFGIPLATTPGDQMMQAPLAYLLFAPLFVGLSSLLDADGVVRAMRILPMACGAAQVELCHRAVRFAHPERADLQRAGVLVGGLLPVNLYLAHAVANEPVVALFGGAAAVAALGVAVRAEPPSRGKLLAAGALLGLALLSKVTALLLLPGIAGAAALRTHAADRSIARAARATALVLGCAALIAGWYYARNWLLLGTPFSGSWHTPTFAAAWQEPGYRSAIQYLSFGEALGHPIYAAVVGVWDGLYASLWLDGGLSGAIARADAPPWNESPLLAGAWLGVVPSLALAAGAVRALLGRAASLQARLCEWIAVGTVGLYVAAILFVHVTLPFYSVAKASYLAAATPLLAVLAASGCAELARVRWARVAIAAALTCWAVNVVSTYWVI